MIGGPCVIEGVDWLVTHAQRLRAMAHLTCVGHTADEIGGTVKNYGSNIRDKLDTRDRTRAGPGAPPRPRSGGGPPPLNGARRAPPAGRGLAARRAAAVRLPPMPDGRRDPLDSVQGDG